LNYVCGELGDIVKELGSGSVSQEVDGDPLRFKTRIDCNSKSWGWELNPHQVVDIANPASSTQLLSLFLPLKQIS